MKLKTVVFTVLILLTSLANAGGPNCAPGYCLDFDGNGCHKCGQLSTDLDSQDSKNCDNQANEEDFLTKLLVHLK
jgi:hypothetical protein